MTKYNPIDNFIYIKESVLVELKNHEYRVNFTLAHELFHYYILNLKILIPTKFIARNCDIDVIASVFNVSFSCVCTRKLHYERRLKSKKTQN